MWSFGSIWRIGCWRSRSSCAWAAMPGTREMMKSALATVGGIPRSPQTAAMAPSMLIGSGGVSGLMARMRAASRPRGSSGCASLRPRAPAPSERGAPRADRACGSGGRTPAARRRFRSSGRRSRPRHPGTTRPRRTSSSPASRNCHAALDVAAVIAAEPEHARGHARAQRRAGRRRIARGQRRRRRGAVIDERHQHRLHQAADARRRTLAHQQQVDRLAERQPAHDLVERIAAQRESCSARCSSARCATCRRRRAAGRDARL